jgi:hypothetical protein
MQIYYQSINQELMIVGDLNINLLNENDQNSKKLLSIMQGYELNHMNKNVPTRVTDHSETLIDHFFSSLQCKNVFETVDVSFSDHRALHAKLTVKVENLKDVFVFSRKFSKQNWIKFYEKLSNENWHEVYDAKLTNEKSELFMKKLIGMYESCFPKGKKTKRANKIGKSPLSLATKVMQVRLRELSEEVRIIKKLERMNHVKKHGKNVDFKMSEHLELLQERLNRQIILVGKLIERDVKRKNDSKLQNSQNKNTTAWNIIKENKNSDTNHQELSDITIEGEKETDLQKIADFLNKNFIEPSIDFTEEQREACLKNVPRITDSKFNLKVVYPWDVQKIIKDMPSKNSSGWDGISINVLKKIAPYVAGPISNIVNCSFLEGVFPENLKLAKILPFYKNKGDRSDPSNYRPIALTSSHLQSQKLLKNALLIKWTNISLKTNYTRQISMVLERGKAR